MRGTKLRNELGRGGIGKSAGRQKWKIWGRVG